MLVRTYFLHKICKMLAIEQTQTWIQEVVIGCNFCPFASKAMLQNSVHYHVMETAEIELCMEQIAIEMQRLDQNQGIETSFIILPTGFSDFFDYLDLLEICDQLVADLNYEGVYQLASFHPDFQFGDALADDAANYTNRSPYPMIHILRESSVSRAVEFYPDVESIPDRNVEFAREKGQSYFLHIMEKILKAKG
jgi:uncharacterized protein